MTLDEAIKRFINNAEYERTHGNLQGCIEFRQLAEWLKELKQLREQTRWIPCSERLPENGDTYLVSGVQEINGEMVPFVDAANYPDSYIDGLWGTFTDWIEGNEVHVLAWQEMPEAWEGCDESKAEG